MPETFSAESRIHDVLDGLGEQGSALLLKHGYDVGGGFTDVLSQYQTLEHAYRVERIRDLRGLLTELNAAPKGSTTPA